MEEFLQSLKVFFVIVDSLALMAVSAYGFGYVLGCLIFGPPKGFTIE